MALCTGASVFIGIKDQIDFVNKVIILHREEQALLITPSHGYLLVQKSKEMIDLSIPSNLIV